MTAVRKSLKSKRQAEQSVLQLKTLFAGGVVDEKTLTARIKTLKEQISKNPHFPDLHYELALAYTLLGRFIHSKSIEEYKEALKLNPDFERARRNLKLAENELKGFDNLIKAVVK
jgi:tetratricopeptide (TPR) repeat protein